MAEVFQQLVQALTPGHATRVRTTGLTGASRAWVLSRLVHRLKSPLVCVPADDAAADGSTGGDPPQMAHLRSVVGLVWRSVVLWMLLVALLTLANLVG